MIEKTEQPKKWDIIDNHIIGIVMKIEKVSL